MKTLPSDGFRWSSNCKCTRTDFIPQSQKWRQYSRLACWACLCRQTKCSQQATVCHICRNPVCLVHEACPTGTHDPWQFLSPYCNSDSYMCTNFKFKHMPYFSKPFTQPLKGTLVKLAESSAFAMKTACPNPKQSCMTRHRQLN
jgi:hypothetical protein